MKKSARTLVVASSHKTGHRASLRAYVTGFALSMLLTLLAFLVVSQRINHGDETFTRGFVIITIMFLAIAQLLVQLQFFIHLGKESGPRWNKLVFLFMLVVVFIVAAGSLWIMNNLHYTMSSNETDTYIFEEEGIKP